METGQLLDTFLATVSCPLLFLWMTIIIITTAAEIIFIVSVSLDRTMHVDKWDGTTTNTGTGNFAWKVFTDQ